MRQRSRTRPFSRCATVARDRARVRGRALGRASVDAPRWCAVVRVSLARFRRELEQVHRVARDPLSRASGGLAFRGLARCSFTHTAHPRRRGRGHVDRRGRRWRRVDRLRCAGATPEHERELVARERALACGGRLGEEPAELGVVRGRGHTTALAGRPARASGSVARTVRSGQGESKRVRERVHV